MIRVLSDETIDKIAAGEVVERPASCVKELCENSIDAGARVINVEIKEGGIGLIRVSDDGCGINKDELKTAFMRHATSKISTIEDLMTLDTLGFRGEALSSIAAVTRLEIITKTRDNIVAARYQSEGAAQGTLSEVGAPDGTTIILKDLFFNTPVRRKFLKSASAEAANVTEVVEMLSLSHPEISFSLINNGRTVLQTYGKGDIKDVIYLIYGRDVAGELIPLNDGIVKGYAAKATVARSTRAMEHFFVNGRYAKTSKVLSKAVEEAYAPYMMQHKFPFVVLDLHLDAVSVDANIHPRKLEVRFSDNDRVYEAVKETLRAALKSVEMIPKAELTTSRDSGASVKGNVNPALSDVKESVIPGNFSMKDPGSVGSSGNIYVQDSGFGNSQLDDIGSVNSQPGVFGLDDSQSDFSGTGNLQPDGFGSGNSQSDVFGSGDHNSDVSGRGNSDSGELPFVTPRSVQEKKTRPAMPFETSRILRETAEYEEKQSEIKSEQLNLFDEKILTKTAAQKFRMVGQVFDTYWIIEYEDKMLLIDQHAAHEKVLYERFVKQIRESGVYSQQLMPPLIVSLTAKQEQALTDHESVITGAGFEVEHYGGREYALRSVPENFISLDVKEIFIEMVDSLALDGRTTMSDEIIKDRIATKACKAAVKGNNTLSEAEAVALIDEMLSLDNPYNCPHGRPTVIVMSKYEMEKKFKRIV